MIQVYEVAKYIREQKGSGSADMTVQKLCYYAQAWHLAWFDAPLFVSRIEAWRDGPVCPELYRAQKHDQALLEGASSLPNQQRLVVDRVLRTYGDRTALELSDLTHREDPWRDARGDAKPHESTTTTIFKDAIRTYFLSLTKSAEEWVESETFDEALASSIEENRELLRRLA